MNWVENGPTPAESERLNLLISLAPVGWSCFHSPSVLTGHLWTLSSSDFTNERMRRTQNCFSCLVPNESLDNSTIHFFCTWARIRHKEWLGMNQHEYEESHRRWLKARAKSTVIDVLKIAAVVGSFLLGLAGTVICLNASYPRPH